ncbi:hypothetical protein [Qipengyuania gaetbuli]|nr:hypothetical protein [Qipengyuania gaetbuli]MCA0910601.1 hypothetical protein [Qipengyuania gaetbuli]
MSPLSDRIAEGDETRRANAGRDFMGISDAIDGPARSPDEGAVELVV